MQKNPKQFAYTANIKCCIKSIPIKSNYFYIDEHEQEHAVLIILCDSTNSCYAIQFYGFETLANDT